MMEKGYKMTDEHKRKIGLANGLNTRFGGNYARNN